MGVSDHRHIVHPVGLMLKDETTPAPALGAATSWARCLGAGGSMATLREGLDALSIPGWEVRRVQPASPRHSVNAYGAED